MWVRLGNPSDEKLATECAAPAEAQGTRLLVHRGAARHFAVYTAADAPGYGALASGHRAQIPTTVAARPP